MSHVAAPAPAETLFDPATALVALPKLTRAIVLVILSAVGAIAFSSAGGFFVYHSTQQMHKTDAWVDHTRVVLEALLIESQTLDGVENHTRLYQVTGDADTYRAVLGTIASLEAGAIHLQTLVSDNLSESRHVQELKAALEKVIEGTKAAKQERSVPEIEIEAARRVVGVMQAEERGLLEQRTAAADKSDYRSLTTGVTYWSISTCVLILLFFFMGRDTLQRQSHAKSVDQMNGKLHQSVQALGLSVQDGLLLKNARDELQLCVSARQAYACAAHHIELILPESSGAALVLNNSRNILSVEARWNQPAETLEGAQPDSCCALRSGRKRWRKPGVSTLHCTHFEGTAPEEYICIPLSALGETFGILSIALPPGSTSPGSRHIELTFELAELASMAIANLNLRAKMEHQSIRDGLTGLFNRHFMETALERELHRATRHGFQLAVLMLDVDHFKLFNDSFGHEAGDLILRDLADSLLSAVRSEDIVCRYGGEEFVIILPEITREHALMRAQAIRSMIAQMQVNFRGERLQQISASIGIGMFPQPARDAVDLVRVADLAMYEAKHGGRDQVCICPEGSTVPAYA